MQLEDPEGERRLVWRGRDTAGACRQASPERSPVGGVFSRESCANAPSLSETCSSHGSVSATSMLSARFSPFSAPTERTGRSPGGCIRPNRQQRPHPRQGWGRRASTPFSCWTMATARAIAPFSILVFRGPSLPPSSGRPPALIVALRLCVNRNVSLVPSAPHVLGTPSVLGNACPSRSYTVYTLYTVYTV